MTYRAWRKERLVYTKKLIIFASPTGSEVIDLIPIGQLVVIRNASDLNAKNQQREFAIDNEDENDAYGADTNSVSQGPSKNSKAALELSLDTEPAGYNSGRAYRVCFSHNLIL